MREIVPSMHFLENFMPVVGNEPFAVKMLEKHRKFLFIKPLNWAISAITLAVKPFAALLKIVIGKLPPGALRSLPMLDFPFRA